ncbi:MAG TPA: MFS transporter [Bacillales bacterium]|nr:MFS transporter [Bacillales bacterium]
MEPQPQGKAAIYLVLFLMSLSLHIQFPIFTPYAVALGATTFFISVMMSSSSFTNMSGNIMAGPFIDRIGKKPFIVIPLFLSAFLMIAHAVADNAQQLFILRILNGFVLAFMSPACFALLSAYAKNTRQQGKNMAVNGITITMAGIAAPFIGGQLSKILTFSEIYLVIGSALFCTALLALFYIREAEPIVIVKDKAKPSLAQMLKSSSLMPIYFIGFALMYGHGTLYYELPFLSVEHGMTTAETGKLFSLMGLGTFASLSLFWLNRFSSLLRTAIGMFLSALFYYQLASSVLPIGLGLTLFGMGISSGLLFPAITTLLTEKVGQDQYGSAFGILSAVFSLGMIVSSLVAGVVHDMMSPYYLAFLVTMCGTLYVVYDYLQKKRTDGGRRTEASEKKEAG